MKKKLCSQKVEKTISHPCDRKRERRECKIVEDVIADVCYDKAEVEEAYKCVEMGEKKVCRKVPKTVKKKELYNCSKTQYKQDCETVVELKEGTCIRNEDKKQAYKCIKNIKEKVCKIVKKQETQTCTRPQIVEEKTQKQCKQVLKKIPWECLKQVKHSVPYDCTDETVKTECITRGPHLKGFGAALHCKSIPAKPKTCFREEVREERYNCVKAVPVEECHNVTVAYDDVCKKKKNIVEDFECVKEVEETQCKDIVKPVESECVRVVQEEVAYKCMKKIPKQECTKVPFLDEKICEREVPVTEEYSCPKTEYVEKCFVVAAPAHVRKSCRRSRSVHVSDRPYSRGVPYSRGGGKVDLPLDESRASTLPLPRSRNRKTMSHTSLPKRKNVLCQVGS